MLGVYIYVQNIKYNRLDALTMLKLAEFYVRNSQRNHNIKHSLALETKIEQDEIL